MSLPHQINMQDQNIADRAQELHQAGQYIEAVEMYLDLLGRYSNNAHLHMLYGASLLSLGNYNEARNAFEKSLEIDPQDTETQVQLARATFKNGDPVKGRSILDIAKDKLPGAEIVLMCQAEFALMEQDYQQACDILAEHVHQEAPEIAIVLTYVRALQRIQNAQACLPILMTQADRVDLSKKNHRQIASKLANLLDKLGHHDEAFEWIMRANKTARHSRQMQTQQQFMDDVTSTTTRESCQHLPISTISDPAPVFVVGMPRAGTTLLEHTVAAHPQAHGMGELMAIGTIAERLYGWSKPGIARIERMKMVHPQSLDREATRHLADLRQGAGSALRIVDKMPNNFALIPIIMQLFPGAKILHARRSPRDTCLSCFFNLDPLTHWYSTHLDELAVFYNQYDRLMSHWKRVLDIPILDVQYERLVLDREAMVREILAFLELPWDEACIAHEKNTRTVYTGSFEQAQQAIYTTSLQRWKHYETQLGPLLEMLQVPEPNLAPYLTVE